jgi:hypothetical protein
LLCVPLFAWASDTGGGQRSLHLYRALAEVADLDVLLVPSVGCEALERLPFAHYAGVFGQAQHVYLQATPALLASPPALLARRAALLLGSRAANYRPATRALHFIQALHERHRYHFIAGRYLRSSARGGALALTGVPTLVDIDDKDEQVIAGRLAEGPSPLLRIALERQARQIGAVTAALLARCCHIWLASDDDRTSLDHPSMSVLPNIPYGPLPPSNPPSADPICVFVGTIAYRPNREGLRRFVARGWPLVVAALPRARLRLVGGGDWSALSVEFAVHPGVEVVGPVKDLNAVYRDASLAVVPVSEGAGTKVKVLEALGHCRPVVAHHHSARGFSRLVDAGCVLTADDDAALAARCVTLLGDPALAAALGAQGRALVERYHSFDAIARRVADDLDRVLATDIH